MFIVHTDEVLWRESQNFQRSVSESLQLSKDVMFTTS